MSNILTKVNLFIEGAYKYIETFQTLQDYFTLFLSLKNDIVNIIHYLYNQLDTNKFTSVTVSQKISEKLEIFLCTIMQFRFLRK